MRYVKFSAMKLFIAPNVNFLGRGGGVIGRVLGFGHSGPGSIPG